MTDLAVEPRASRRRWLRRLLLVPVVALVAAVITIIVWLLLTYHHIASDLSSSRARVPHSVFATLAPRGSVLEKPQITIAIARGPDGRTAPILFRSDPDRRVMGLLGLPIVQRDASEAAVVRSVSQLIGADINHVLFLSPAALGSIVDAIGPITIRNPRPADYLRESGGWHFPAGSITLDATRALAFMSATSETTAAARAQLLLDGVVRDLLARSTVSELRHALDSITASAATDLTASDLLGTAWLRFRSETLLRCEVTSQGEARTALSAAALRVFLGRTTGDGDVTATGCSATPLHPSSIPLPPQGVVTVVRSIYPHLWQVALGVFAAVFVLAAMLIVGPRRLWMHLKGLRLRGPVGVPAARNATFALAHALPSAAATRRWLHRNRSGIFLYTFAIVIAVTVALLVVGWASGMSV
jgi:hypothetical protein